MSIANHDDIVRLFPGIDDHTVVEIQSMRATVDELEAASLLLGDQDEDLIEARRKASSRISSLLIKLNNAGITAPDERD